MKEPKLVIRTAPITFEEICDFIDTTSISKLDKHELKSRIADCVQGERKKTIDDFAKALCKAFNDTTIIESGYFPNNVVRLVAGEMKEVHKNELS